MTGAAVGGLMLAGFLVLILLDRGVAGAMDGRPTQRFAALRPGSRPPAVEPSELPLFVHQLTALLQAGRSPQQLWQDVALVYSVDSDGTPPVSGGFGRHALPVLWAAHQAAAIGAGVPDVFRNAAADSFPREHWRPGRARTPPADVASLWNDLAICLDITEQSGAPLVEVLGRYAAQLEQALESAASRATALAGPAATARLLGWFPVVGLGLGYLTGAQPLAILFTSPTGWVLLGTGVSLMTLGRLWSSRLVRAAAVGG